MLGHFLLLFGAFSFFITEEAGQHQSPSSLLFYSSTNNPLWNTPKVPSPRPHGALPHFTQVFGIHQSLLFPLCLKPHAYTQP